MKKKINIFINIANLFAGLISLFSGVIIWIIFSSGQGFRGGRGDLDINLFLGLERHNWVDIHTISSLIFIGLIITHLILHWYWIKNLPKIIKE
jgi:hypothetical protein